MNKNNAASNIAKGGLLTAFGVLSLYLSSNLPTNRIFFISLATCFIIISIIISGIRNGILVYISTALLAFLICGVRISTVSYLLFFGLYGFIKYYIEGHNKLVLEYILKLGFFNLFLIVLFVIYKQFLPSLFTITTSIYLIAAGGQIFFLIYDYTLSLFISYFKKRYSKI